MAVDSLSGTFWQDMLVKYKIAMQKELPESWFKSSVENSREMKTVWLSVHSRFQFVEQLELRAQIEREGGTSTGGIGISIGGA